jgi:hypothetical protein
MSNSCPIYGEEQAKTNIDGSAQFIGLFGIYENANRRP